MVRVTVSTPPPAVVPLSITVTVIVAEPWALATGVKLMLPALAVVFCEYVTVGAGISPVSLELADTMKVCALSLAAPAPMPVRFTVCAVASSLMFR